MKLGYLALAAACTLSFTASAAVPLSAVAVPVGDYASQALAWAQPLAVTAVSAAIAYGCRALPGWAGSLASEFLTQQRIESAVNYAVTQVEGATKGKTVSVEVGNTLVATAEQYLLKSAPWVASTLGNTLKPMILAQVAKIGVAPEGKLAHVTPAKA